MKCKEFEEKIYLYEELNDSEKAKIDEHRSHCQACDKLADHFFQSQALIKKVSTSKAELKNPYQLTQQIMNSIVKEKRGVSVLDQLSSYLDNLFIRYAFGVASLWLVAFFLYEQQTIDQLDPIKVIKTEIKSGPVLEMNTFLNHYRNQRVNKEPVPISRYAYYKSVRSVKTYNQ